MGAETPQATNLEANGKKEINDAAAGLEQRQKEVRAVANDLTGITGEKLSISQLKEVKDNDTKQVLFDIFNKLYGMPKANRPEKSSECNFSFLNVGTEDQPIPALSTEYGKTILSNGTTTHPIVCGVIENRYFQFIPPFSTDLSEMQKSLIMEDFFPKLTQRPAENSPDNIFSQK